MIGAVLSILVSAPADPPLVAYTTKVETKSWEPIGLREVETFLEAEVLEVVSGSGAMRLEKGGFSDLAGGDYSLVVSGRFVEEAERFSVYLSFAKQKRADVPSFFATHTSDPLGKKPRAEMQRLIALAATEAAKRLIEVLGPQLAAVRASAEPPVLEEPELPLEFGGVDVPRVESKDRAIRTLLDVRNWDHDRHEALNEIEGHVFDQQEARNAVELCLLRDPTPSIRVRCARALKPVARTSAPTQRIILFAMRSDVDDSVLSELVDISQTFVGLSRLETIATWLHLLAADATPPRGAEEVARLLGDEEDVPNLDHAIAACLQQEAIMYGKKTACAELLGDVPPPRRRAVVWKYLADVRVFDQGESNTFERVLGHVLERQPKGSDPQLGQLMIDLAERESTGHGRYKVLYLSGDHAPAIPANLQRLVALTYDETHARGALRAIEDMTERAPDLTEMAIGALKRVREKARYFVRPHSGDPYRELDDSIDRLERRIERKKKG